MADFSAGLNKFIFPAYKFALGRNEITGYDNNNVALSWITQDIPAAVNDPYFWTKGCASPLLRYEAFKGRAEVINGLKFDDIYLQGVRENTFNRNTSTSAETTYQAMCKIPPEHYLFTKGLERYTSASPIIHDRDYNVSAYSAVTDYTNVDKTAGRRANALHSEYDLSGIYSSALYNQLNIPEDPIIESNVNKVADALEYADIKKNGTLQYGARGFVLSYTDDKHIKGQMIPMAYYEFPQTIYSNNDYIKIEWNANGFLEVE